VHHRSSVFLLAMLLGSFGFIGLLRPGCWEQRESAPPVDAVITNVQSGSVTTSASQVVWTTKCPCQLLGRLRDHYGVRK